GKGRILLRLNYILEYIFLVGKVGFEQLFNFASSAFWKMQPYKFLTVDHRKNTPSYPMDIPMDILLKPYHQRMKVA
ncbi:MAG TPA: hypothetical protein VGB07_05105, partial [Blastocatellia bacterium]